MARTFARFEPLDAYRLDIGGSLLGIVTFAGLSFLRMPPLAWAVVSAAVFVVLLGPRVRSRRWLPAVGITAVVVMLGLESFVGSYQWSPYYKIHTETASGGNVRIDVNNTPLQTTASVAQITKDSPFYLYPYTYAGPHDDVLVIGAGTGNDVAVALSQGATRVDAVEIDPALVQIGRDRHPDRPYSDPRVTVHVDDGRAFMERAASRYDLVLFALPDSATIVTGQSALRLENYLFTTQALTRARSLLEPGRHLRDVQLLRAVAARPLRQHHPHRLRHRALRAARAHARPAPAGGAVAARRRLDRRVHDHVDPAGRRARAVGRRPAVPLPRHPHHPVVLPVDARRWCWSRRSCWCAGWAAR